jgi:hypothetical protein
MSKVGFFVLKKEISGILIFSEINWSDKQKKNKDFDFLQDF